MKQFLLFSTVAVLVLTGTRQANATPIIFTGSGTSPNDTHDHLAAQAEFSLSGNTLSLKVTNTNTQFPSKYVPTDLIEAVFFDLNKTPTLTYTSGTAPKVIDKNGTIIHNNYDVTNQWFFAQSTGSSSLTGVSQHYGIGTAGLGIFNTSGGQQFPYGIVDLGFTGTNGNLPVDAAPLIQNSATYTFTVNPNMSLSDISNVRFQYGTSLDEGSFNGFASSPEPSSFVLLGGCAIGLCGYGWRRRNHVPALAACKPRLI